MSQNNIQIYLISGKSLNGKDTLFKICKENLRWENVSFAYKLKETVKDLFGLTNEQVYGNLKDIEDTRYLNNIDAPLISTEVPTRVGPLINTNPNYKKYLTPRRIMQVFGQDQRKINPDIWVSYVFNNTIPDLMRRGVTRIAITDVRFKNEIEIAEKLKPVNSKLIKIRVNRPGYVSKTSPNDISEIDLDDYTNWDLVLINDGTEDSFRDKSIKLINKLN